MASSMALKFGGREWVPALPRESWYWAGLLVSYFLLLGVSRAITFPAAVLLLVGVHRSVLLLREHGLRGLPQPYKWLLLIFALYWLPLLLSLPDAQYPRLSGSGTLRQLPYVFIGIACVWLALEKKVIAPFTVGLSCIAFFWTVDVLFQRVVGHDLFGIPYQSATLRAGAYFKSEGKFGTYLGCMGLLALYAMAALRVRLLSFGLVWLALFVAIIVSMSRTGWFIFMIFSVPLLWHYSFSRLRHAWLWAAVSLLVFSALIYFYYQHDPSMQARLGRTMALREGLGYDAWNELLTYRLDLWRASVQMIGEHWFNGMGLQAFNKNFAFYPSAPAWHNLEPAHEHQYLLQVMDATGLVGLAGIVAIHIVLFRLWWRSAADKTFLFPVVIYLGAMWFPLSTHFSFYSSEMAWANFLMLGLLVGALFVPKAGKGSVTE